MIKKTFILCSLLLAVTSILYAQTQQGYVRTLERPDAKGVALEGVTVWMQGGHNAVVSGKKGLFRLPMDGKRNGDSYSLLQVTKNGYELADMGVVGREYAFSDRVPLTVVMVSIKQLLADKQRIESNAYMTAERNYHLHLETLEQQLADSAISEETYRIKLQELQQNLEHYQSLVEDLADHYARTDYALLDAKERDVNLCIERGELEKADSLLATMFNPMGVLERNREAIADADRRLAEGQGLMEQAQRDLAAVLRQQEKDAEYLYQLYTIALARFDNDKARKYIETRAALDTTNDTWQLEAGMFIYRYIADYNLALSYYNRILHIQKVSQETNLTKLSAVHNAMGMLYCSQGNYTLALNHLNTSLEYERQFGDTLSLAVSSAYNNIATVYSAMGNKSEALKYYMMSEDIDKQYYEKESVAFSTLYNNIGSVLSDLRKHKEAMQYYRKSLEIREKILGSNHLQTALAYHNIGYEYALYKDYDSALINYQKALEIREQQLGFNHPDVASSYNGIGTVYIKQKEYLLATEYLQKALMIWKRVYGDDNLRVAKAYNNLGYLYAKQRKIIQSEECYLKALSIRESVLGKEHEEVAEICTSLGTVDALQKKFSQAMEYYYRALKIYEKKKGHEGNATITAKQNIASLLREHGDEISGYVYVFIVVGNDTPAARKGMSGEYIVLEMEDWNIVSKEPLMLKNEELRGKPKSVVVIKDEIIQKHQFENTMGVAISLRYIGDAEEGKIIQKYHEWLKKK